MEPEEHIAPAEAEQAAEAGAKSGEVATAAAAHVEASGAEAQPVAPTIDDATNLDVASQSPAAAVVEAPTPIAPTTLGQVGAYELLIELAAGGMATVFLARATDKRNGPPLVAVKRPHRHLASDKTFLTMLVDEARLASAIQHENVVRVRELGFEAGVPFIIMDYIEGASLAELRRELAAAGRAMDVRVGSRVILDALAGLSAAHDLKDESGRHLGIIHRDVSPHNVLLGCDGRAHLTDFGIAKAEDRIQVTKTHEVKGKLAYLAPERIDKRRICNVQSDVFSMAVVMWECFAGRRLFRGEDAVETLQEVMTAPIPTLRQIGAQIPPALDDVIARALSRDLETRYPSAAEFAAAIERALGRENIASHADVARLMEAIFGARMAARHDLVRNVVGSGDLEELLEQSGLPPRQSQLPPGSTNVEALSSLAPPAPSARYSFGKPLSEGLARLRPGRRQWITAGLVGAGLVLGVAVTAAVMSRRPAVTPIVVRPPTPPATIVSPSPSVRRVVVPLPFVATHVTFDDATRDLDPAIDVAAFDVPSESGLRHRVTAVAIDGTRAEAYVREADGVARPESDFSTTPPSSPPVSADGKGAPRLLPVGKTKNGFTKLK